MPGGMCPIAFVLNFASWFLSWLGLMRLPLLPYFLEIFCNFYKRGVTTGTNVPRGTSCGDAGSTEDSLLKPVAAGLPRSCIVGAESFLDF